jgi:hypothetical protein
MNTPANPTAILRNVAEALNASLSAAKRRSVRESRPRLQRVKRSGENLKSFEVKFTNLPTILTRGKWTGKIWSFRCNCTGHSDCWHMLSASVCVLHELDVGFPEDIARPAGLRPREVKATPTGASDSSGAHPGAGPSSASTPGPAAARISHLRGPLAEIVEEKLRRPITPDEEAFLENVETLHRKNAHSQKLSAEALQPFCRGHRLPIWEIFQLWPAPPKDVWEAWLYLSNFLRSRNVPAPEFLEKITPLEELQNLGEGWAHNRMMQAWEQNVQRLLVEYDQEHVSPGCWDLRLLIGPSGARLQSRTGESQPWGDPSAKEFPGLLEALAARKLECTEAAFSIATLFHAASAVRNELGYHAEETRDRIARMILSSHQRAWVCLEEGEPVRVSEEKFAWSLHTVCDEGGAIRHYQLRLGTEQGTPVPKPWFYVAGKLNCLVADGVLHRTAPLLRLDPTRPFDVPVDGFRSNQCMRLLEALGVPMPEEFAARVVRIRPEVRIRAWLSQSVGGGETLLMEVMAFVGTEQRVYTDTGWEVRDLGMRDPHAIVSTEMRLLKSVPGCLSDLGMRSFDRRREEWHRAIGKRFPEEFCNWLNSIPEEIKLELDSDLESLRSAEVSGSLRLEVEENSPDWFDVRVALSVSDTELTREEIQLLMQARGEFVRLSGKGWRRLDFQIDEQDAAMIEDLGLNPMDHETVPQRFHTIQLVRSKAQALLGSDDRSALQRRAADLKLDCTPPVPSCINATLRPYQVEGFHFLVYLSSNRFGGILADDMGLGKTLQTLTWMQWLREQSDYTGRPFLVVCPKSVVQNWISESGRFVPGLRANVWTGGDLDNLRECMSRSDLIVVNYTQLRLGAQPLGSREWHAVVLDEAQYIKNPASQTAVAACALRGTHRLALSGTPIENRLMDLWSIMQFSMPGLLGVRTQFQKRFDSRSDVLARKRLSSRVRPFVLRRTKAEVASDLPARIEEDLVVEMEGTQALLYSAELKNARQELLKIKTSKEFDKKRFNVLTSLLRLRQICCHPGLVSEEHGHADSAKLDALVDLLEPLMEEGHKVLVFSQFVEMLERIEREITAREWPSFLLTGETENRGELVDSFQNHSGAAVFLISLRAGGMGLNLTAASYVILYDPWWNPAVENQAIDRTHRIGQTQQVIAYRLIARNSVEQKIRQLQQSKCSLAGDILGEESLAKALSIDDFRFLMDA